MTILVQYSLPYFTGLARDVSANTFHFNWSGLGDPAPGDYNALAGVLDDFYEASYANTSSDGGIAPWFTQEGRAVMYDLNDPEPRTPVYDETSSLDLPTSSPQTCAMENAMCLSYRASYPSGVNRASRRGRIYLGGLINPWIDGGTADSFPMFKTTAIARVAGAALQLIDDALLASWTWVIYSRKLSTSGIIIAGWIDREIDTQRRRGNAVTAARIPWAA